MIFLNITGHTVEKLVDPFGLLSGDRYEFFLEVEVEEDDELFNNQGIGIRVLFVVDESGLRIANYHLYERSSDKILDFELEEDEELLVFNYCKENMEP